MLKMLCRKLNKNKDYRFLDVEAYRKDSNALSDKDPIFKLSEIAALKVDFCSVTEMASLEDIQYFRKRNIFSIAEETGDQDFITLDLSPEKQLAPDFNNHSFVSHAKHFEINNVTYINHDAVSASNPINDEVGKSKLSQFTGHLLTQPKLGIFSDSKVYSAFLRTELAGLEVDIQHFNHPRTLDASNNSHLACIDAWIIFLSEEAEDDFLDVFFDRFIEKPTLFLVPKTGRKTSASSIKAFIQNLVPENTTS